MTTAPKKQPILFGQYLLLDRVNIGGMAEVWRAKTFGAGGFERVLAIKRILPNIAEDEEFITMFIDEAKITVLLSHANIAQVHDMNNLSNNYYIAMEYVSGKDMRAVFDRCRKRGEPAPIPLSCYSIAQCCEGLDYAHRAKDKQGRDMNIVHRDVSPQNALISYEGEVKVIDFGIAKAAGKATKTQAGILKGKFGYMSPEQIRGLPLDRRSDVFAMGVCLYEMLTGERLFVGDSDFSVLEKVRKVEVLPPSHFNRKIPEQLERIVMKSLAKDVDERYQYASELGEDLRAFMYSTGNVFSRKDLAAFMKATFAEDYDKERQRMQEYAEIKPPEAMLAMLAAKEMGYVVGSVPAAPGSNTSASSVTSIPTMVPPGAAPMVQAVTSTAQTATGLPPMVRPMPPSSAPVRPSGATPTGPVPARSPSMPSIPRLTAVAPMLTNGKEEHNATVLVDGGAPFDDATNPGQAPDPTRALDVRGMGQEVATDPGRPAIPRTATAGAMPAANNDWNQPPTLAAQPQQQGMRPGPPVLMPNDQPRRQTRTGNPAAPPNWGPSETAPTLSPVGQSGYLPASQQSVQSMQAAQSAAMLPAVPAQNNTRLIIALAGIVALLLVGVVAAVLLRPTPTGLLIINIPEDVQGKVMVQINGEAVTEKDGTPLKEWPAVRPVKVGRATVRLTAPGYEPLLEIVTVKEQEPVELSKEMKKSK